MLAMNDPIWETLQGGYRVPYDPRPALRRLEQGEVAEQAWTELWNELHHQGDVDLASFAAVPHLVRIYRESDRRDGNFYHLIATIEMERDRGTNPDVPDDWREAYQSAWNEAARMAHADLGGPLDSATSRGALTILAIHQGHRVVGHCLAHSTDDELTEWMGGGAQSP